MYTKYEEMKVMQSILEGYITTQKARYEELVKKLKEESKDISFEIDNSDEKIKDISATIESLSRCKDNYTKGIEALKELEKAIMCFEMGYTQENVQSGLADQRMKEGKKLFFELRTKNDAYKSIMENIAYDLYIKYNRHMADLITYGLDDELERLDFLYRQKAISKEELIYYTNMCIHFSQRKDYDESKEHSSTQSRGTR